MIILKEMKSAAVVSISRVIACLAMFPVASPLLKKITFDGPVDVHGRPKDPPVYDKLIHTTVNIHTAR